MAIPEAEKVTSISIDDLLNLDHRERKGIFLNMLPSAQIEFLTKAKEKIPELTDGKDRYFRIEELTALSFQLKLKSDRERISSIFLKEFLAHYHSRFPGDVIKVINFVNKNIDFLSKDQIESTLTYFKETIPYLRIETQNKFEEFIKKNPRFASQYLLAIEKNPELTKLLANPETTLPMLKKMFPESTNQQSSVPLKAQSSSGFSLASFLPNIFSGNKPPETPKKTEIQPVLRPRLEQKTQAVAAPPDNYHFKISFLGDSSVGKTSLYSRYTANSFSDIGHESLKDSLTATKAIQIEGKTVKLTIMLHRVDSRWDSRGRTVSNLTQQDGIIVVFDLTDKQSFENVRQWLCESSYNSSESTVRFLVGCKSDLKAERKVTEAEARDYAGLQGISYLEASAKTGENVDKLFETIAGEILKRREQKLRPPLWEVSGPH